MKSNMEYIIDVARIRSKMGLLGLNIGNLSDKMGVSRDTVSKILHGQKPTYTSICKMVQALDLSPHDAESIFFVPNLRKT